jgi:5'-phosphate synthase pdxT subunit
VGGEPPVGVLALQGDFEAHIGAFARLNVLAVPVRHASELAHVDRLVIPGGESTTVSRLLSRWGLDEQIVGKAASGMPVWGTCMGVILMGRSIGRQAVPTLRLLNIEVERNGYGAQVDSFEADLVIRPLGQAMRGVFIRAPIIRSVGDGVEVLAEHGGLPVAVRQGRMLGTTFHPELTEDPAIQSLFLSL